MKKRKSFFASYIYSLIIILATIYGVILLYNLKQIDVLVANLLTVITCSLCGVYIYFKRCNKIIWYRIFFVASIGIACVVLIFAISERYDLLKLFTNASNIKDFILDKGGWGVLIFICIQVAQSVFVPMPAVILVFVGTLIYGPWLCAIFCSIGVLIGSYISFGIGKIFGRKVVAWMIGKDNLEYYSNAVQGRETIFLVLTFLLPLFPDDLLCLVAGITKMTFKEFFFVALFTRPVGMTFLCVFGGSIFDFKNNYVMLLFLIAAALIVFLFLLLFKKQRKFIFDESKNLIKNFAFKK